MSDITTTIDDYIAAWNEGDEARRRDLVARTFSADAHYLDPLMESEGTNGIAAMIGAARRQYPGHRFELAAGPDAHHDRVRFSWRLTDGNGGHVVTGVDFATLDDAGRLRSVTGFLETAA